MASFHAAPEVGRDCSYSFDYEAMTDMAIEDTVEVAYCCALAAYHFLPFLAVVDISLFKASVRRLYPSSFDFACSGATGTSVLDCNCMAYPCVGLVVSYSSFFY